MQIRQFPTHTIFVFEVVKVGATKNCRCSVCGKSMKRAKTFEGTLNPLNKNADGSPRTREQMLEVLRAKIPAWKLEPETHEKCKSRSYSQ